MSTRRRAARFRESRTPRAPGPGQGLLTSGGLDAETEAVMEAARREGPEAGREERGPKGRVRRASDAGRELAMLDGGTRSGWWTWTDALEASQEAARRFEPGHPSGELAAYVRTERQADHPTDPTESGVVYEWRPTSEQQ